MKRRLWSKSFVRMTPLPWMGGYAGSLVFILIAFVFLAVSVFNPQGIGTLRAGVSDIFSPVLSFVSKPAQDAAVFVRNVTGLAEMQAENIRLQKENMRLREWYQTALVLEAENQSLRDLLNVKIDPQSRYITARILADSGNTFVKSLLVAAGKKDGVEKGQAVVSGNGVIGRIVDAGQKTSRVLLITDINSRVPVLVENSRQHAILAGANNNSPVLVHLPPDSDVEEGARIITSGHGGVFPSGLPVGRVVRGEDGGVHIELYADFDRMIHVRVIDRPEDPNLRSGELE